MAWGNNGWNNKKQENTDTNETPVEEEDKALSWDDEEYTCEDAPEYILLKPGEYDFKVQSFERAYYNGNSEKNIPPCPQAKVTLFIETPEGNALVYENFFLRLKVKWMFDNFFRALGVAKPNQPYKPDWQRIVGMTGRCFIDNREYNGKKYNQVKRYIFPED